MLIIRKSLTGIEAGKRSGWPGWSRTEFNEKLSSQIILSIVSWAWLKNVGIGWSTSFEKRRRELSYLGLLILVWRFGITTFTCCLCGHKECWIYSQRSSDVILQALSILPGSRLDHRRVVVLELNSLSETISLLGRCQYGRRCMHAVIEEIKAEYTPLTDKANYFPGIPAFETQWSQNCNHLKINYRRDLLQETSMIFPGLSNTKCICNIYTTIPLWCIAHCSPQLCNSCQELIICCKVY